MSAQPVPYQTAAVPIVRAWLAIYTAGADAAARTRRRQQIESDLWEEHATASAEGVARWRVATAVLGRMVRGAPSDILWRLRIGGAVMEFNIRFEKLVGIALVVLVPCLWVALSIQSYDLSQEGWSSELTRMGGIGAGESAGTVILQFAAGMGLVLAGAALAVTLRTRAPMAGALSGALIGASGLLVLAASALYGATANLARDYVETGGGPSTLETTRALMLGVGGLTIAAFIAAGIGVYTMAAVAAQKRLVPRALGWIAAVSAVSVVAAIVTDPFTDSSWLFFILGAFTMLIWLLLAGGMLVFGKHTLTPGTAVTAPA